MLERLYEYNDDPVKIQKIILHLANPKECPRESYKVNEVIKKLNDILSVEGYKVYLEGIAPKIKEISSTIPKLDKTLDHFAIWVPEFNKFTGYGNLANISQSRWEEVVSCIEGKAYLAAIILMESVLEGVLLTSVQRYPREANQASSASKDKNEKVK